MVCAFILVYDNKTKTLCAPVEPPFCLNELCCKKNKKVLDSIGLWGCIFKDNLNKCRTFGFEGSLGGVSPLDGLSISSQTLVERVDFPAHCDMGTALMIERRSLGSQSVTEAWRKKGGKLTLKVFNVQILKLPFDLAKQVKEVAPQSEGQLGVLDTWHTDQELTKIFNTSKACTPFVMLLPQMPT